jgi:hypothetical protein
MGASEDQAKYHEEALRRASPTRELPADFVDWRQSDATGGLQTGDTWSSGGIMPGVTTPDLQGPTKALTYPDNPGGEFAEGNDNAEDIIRGRR